MVFFFDTDNTIFLLLGFPLELLSDAFISINVLFFALFEMSYEGHNPLRRNIKNIIHTENNTRPITIYRRLRIWSTETKENVYFNA